jgi:hypothetical protein
MGLDLHDHLAAVHGDDDAIINGWQLILREFHIYYGSYDLYDFTLCHTSLLKNF